MLNHFGIISGVVRHMLPAAKPQFQGLARPHSQIEKVMGYSLSPVSNATFFVADLRALPIH